jgi:hypothetical protein
MRLLIKFGVCKIQRRMLNDDNDNAYVIYYYYIYIYMYIKGII